MSSLIARDRNDITGLVADMVSMPGDEKYAAAIATWAKQDGIAPRLVAHCRTAQHVQAAIRVARERDLPLSVRGGGHDWAGRALCDGVVIDLAPMRGVTLDSDRGAVTIGGGTRVCDVMDVVDRHGLAVVAGSVASVGLPGLTLGGGYGPLIGRFGLALDNMLDAQVVLADGRIVFTSPGRNEDLFWALRGGGGNFGVVTAMRLRLHELPSVHTGLLAYPFAQARSVLENCEAIAQTMPDEFSVQVGIACSPDGPPAVMVIPTWCGAPEEGEKRLAPMLRLGTLLDGIIERKSYEASLHAFDALVLGGLRVFVDCCWLPSLDSGSIDTMIAAMEGAVSPACMIFTHDFKGAASRVPLQETAFGLRRDHVMVDVGALFPDSLGAEDAERHRDWVRNTRKAFAHALPGGYPNMLGRDAGERATLSFGSNAERLVRTKRRYDPDNVFSSAIPLPQQR